MSTSGGSVSKKKELDQDVELNIASIVDCFTVLITYLLAAASFVSIGAIDAGLARTSDGDDASAQTQPAVFLSMELSPEKMLRIKSVGAINDTRTFEPSADGAWSFEQAVEYIKSIQHKYPSVNSVTLLSDNSIQYRDIIAAVHATKKALPVFFVKTESL